MSVGKDHVVERHHHRVVVVTTSPRLAGSGVIMHRMHPSVGQFKHRGNVLLQSRVERMRDCYGCPSLRAAYAQSIAPVCSYGVFNTKVLERSLKARCAGK